MIAAETATTNVGQNIGSTCDCKKQLILGNVDLIFHYISHFMNLCDHKLVSPSYLPGIEL